jgi:hypothetical protein
MISNIATTTWMKGLLLLGLATAVFTTPVMGIEDSLSSSTRTSGGKSYLKGSKNKKQQGQRSLNQGGLAYKIDFAAADPDLYNTPTPYPDIYNAPDKLIIGLGDGSIPFAKFNDASSSGPSANVRVESLTPEDLYLGQIVPFEIKITVSGLEAAEDGKIQVTAGWSTETTSKGDFGYDFQTYGVLAAFVDTADGAHIDTGLAASVTSFTWSHVIDVKGNEIQGVFEIEGLDDGDEVVIEVWVVIQSTFPSAGATGNVHSRLIDAKTLTTEDAIDTGMQIIPVMKVQARSPPADTFRFATPADEDVLFC